MLAHIGDILWRDGHRHFVNQMSGAGSADQSQLLLPSGVAHAQPHKKSVGLGLGKREGSIGFQWILGGHDHKWLFQLVGLAVHGNLPLLHGFQQARLRPRRGPVDFVRQNDVGKKGTRTKLKIPRFLVVEIDARQIGGQQIRGELNPAEFAPQSLGEGPEHHSLASAGHILQQHMTGADKAGQHQLRCLPLAHNGRTHLIQHSLFKLRKPLGFHIRRFLSMLKKYRNQST